MAGDYFIEIQLQRSVQSLGPFEKAASLRVINIDVHARSPCRRRCCIAWRCSSKKKVSSMYDLEIRKVDNRIAVRVTAPEILCSNFLAAEVYGEFIRESYPRQADRRARRVLIVRLLDMFEVGSNISMCNDLSDWEHLEIAAGMIVVLMRVDDVLDRLVCNRLYLSQNVRVVSIEHVVDEDHSLGSDVCGDIPAFP